MSTRHSGNGMLNEMTFEEHDGVNNAKRVNVISTVGIASDFSYYKQSSLASGYVFHGLASPGSNPTVANFKIQRETLNTGEFLFASGVPTFTNIWSSASLSSINYL